MFIAELNTYIFKPTFITVNDGGVDILNTNVTSNGRVVVKLARLGNVTVGTETQEFEYTTPIYSSDYVLSREDSLKCFNDSGKKHKSEAYVKFLEKNPEGSIEDERIVKSFNILSKRLSEKKVLKVVKESLSNLEEFDSAQAIDIILNEQGALDVPMPEEEEDIQDEEEVVENEEPVSIIGEANVGGAPVSAEVVSNTEEDSDESSTDTVESIL